MQDHTPQVIDLMILGRIRCSTHLKNLHSPDLNLYDRFLFQKIESKLKRVSGRIKATNMIYVQETPGTYHSVGRFPGVPAMDTARPCPLSSVSLIMRAYTYQNNIIKLNSYDLY